MHDKNRTSLLKLAVPLMAANALETVYNITDTFFLGKLGAAEVAAPPVAMNVLFLMMVFGIGLSTAGATLISQSRGKENREGMDFYLGQMIFLMTLVSLLITALGLIISNPILMLMKTPEEVAFHAGRYLSIMFLGMPFMFLFFGFQSAMQGVGNTLLPLKIQAFTVSLNILLDYLLIFGAGPLPGLGVPGAALATVITRGTAMSTGLFFLIRGKHGIRLRLTNLKPIPESIRLYLKVGIPASTGQVIASLGFTVLQGIVNSFGTPVIAAFGICNRVNSFFYMPAMGLSRAVASLVGRNIGAGDEKGARDIMGEGVKIALLYIIPCMALMFFFGGETVRLFVSDPETIYWGRICFRMISPSIIVFTVFLIFSGGFQGAGDTKSVMYMNISRLWVFRLPLAFLFVSILGWGPQGLYGSMIASNLAVAVMGVLRYFSGKWAEVLADEKL